MPFSFDPLRRVVLGSCPPVPDQPRGELVDVLVKPARASARSSPPTSTSLGPPVGSPHPHPDPARPDEQRQAQPGPRRSRSRRATIRHAGRVADLQLDPAGASRHLDRARAVGQREAVARLQRTRSGCPSASLSWVSPVGVEGVDVLRLPGLDLRRPGPHVESSAGLSASGNTERGACRRSSTAVGQEEALERRAAPAARPGALITPAEVKLPSCGRNTTGPENATLPVAVLDRHHRRVAVADQVDGACRRVSGWLTSSVSAYGVAAGAVGDLDVGPEQPRGARAAPARSRTRPRSS